MTITHISTIVGTSRSQLSKLPASVSRSHCSKPRSIVSSTSTHCHLRTCQLVTTCTNAADWVVAPFFHQPRLILLVHNSICNGSPRSETVHHLILPSTCLHSPFQRGSSRNNTDARALASTVCLDSFRCGRGIRSRTRTRSEAPKSS